MMYAHIAAVNSAARRVRAVELSAYDLAGDEGGWEEFESAIPGARRKKKAGGGYSYKYPKGGGAKPAAGSKKGGKSRAEREDDEDNDIASGQAIIFGLRNSSEKEISDALVAAQDNSLDDVAVQRAAKEVGVRPGKTQAQTVARIVDKIHGTNHEQQLLARQKAASKKPTSKKAAGKKAPSEKDQKLPLVGELKQMESQLKERGVKLTEIQEMLNRLLEKTGKK